MPEDTNLNPEVEATEEVVEEVVEEETEEQY